MAEVRVDAQALDHIFAPFASDSEPGLAVGIALHGQPVYRRGFGVASVELAVPLTSGIRMRIGSVSKHFAALALLLLIEERRASLDDRVRSHVPILPPHADGVTLRHLLQHTSGLRCGLDILMSMAGCGVPIPELAVIDVMARQETVQFAPGTSWNYNNGGYSLIGAVIEKLAARPLGEVLRERLFAPLDMRDTMLRAVDTDLVPNSATLHVPSRGGWTRGVFGASLGAAGGIVSTVDDMLRWLSHMHAPTVGSTDSWAAMRRPAILESGHSTGYGLGLLSGTWRHHRLIHHAGGVIGGSAQMMALPDLGLDLILIANRADIDLRQLARNVLDACVPGDDPPRAPEPRLAARGTFCGQRSGMVIELATEDGRPSLKLMGTAIPVRFRADGDIALEVDAGTKIHVPAGETEPASIDYVGLGGRETLERIAPPDEVDAALLGDYVSVEAQAEARIVADEAVRLETRSRYGTMTYQLRPIGRGLWSLATADAPVPFGGILERDERGVRFSTRRARRLSFVRRRRA